MKRPVALFAVCIACSVLLFSNQVKAQIVINEFMASNTGSVVDPDFNESADWIELYNAGPSDVNIGGYWLTDNFNNKQKWQIPAGTSINSHGFIIIWADSRNTGLHTSFNISASGEELAIFNQAGNLIDSISFGLQEPNISMGRKTDGALRGYFS